MKIIGIGANFYKRESERDLLSEELLIFTKPASSIAKGSVWHYPSCSLKVFYEMEIVLKINKTLSKVTTEEAYNAFDEIALGIDWTAKDLQAKAKEKGFPWAFAKGFDEATFLSEFLPVSEFEDVRNLNLTFKVNGETREKGNIQQLKANYEQIISYTSQFMTLHWGDLIMTGAPPSPGEIFKGDHCEGFIGDRKLLDFKVV